MARERVPWEESGKGKALSNGKVMWLKQGMKHVGREEETRVRGVEKAARRGKVTVREKAKHTEEKNVCKGKSS